MVSSAGISPGRKTRGRSEDGLARGFDEHGFRFDFECAILAGEARFEFSRGGECAQGIIERIERAEEQESAAAIEDERLQTGA